MDSRRKVWQQDSMSDWIRFWLPDICQLMKMATHFVPPDAERHGRMPFDIYYHPATLEESMWQVEFVVLPKLREHFVHDPKAENSFSAADEELVELDEKRAKNSQAIFPAIFALTLISPVISHAHLALIKLQEPSWGKAVNTASTIGLLAIGEKDVNLDCLPEVFGEFDLPEKWEFYPSHKRWKKNIDARQEFDPAEVPFHLWRQAIETLRCILDKTHPSLQTLLHAAWELGYDPLAKEILLLAMDVGYYNEFLHGAIESYLEDHHLRKDETDPEILRRLRNYLSDSSFLENEPELFQKVEHLVARYETR